MLYCDVPWVVLSWTCSATSFFQYLPPFVDAPPACTFLGGKYQEFPLGPFDDGDGRHALRDARVLDRIIAECRLSKGLATVCLGESLPPLPLLLLLCISDSIAVAKNLRNTPVVTVLSLCALGRFVWTIHQF